MMMMMMMYRNIFRDDWKSPKKVSPVLPLTGGVVEVLSRRTGAGLVEREHRHHVRVAAPAVVGAVVAGGVACLLAAVAPLDEGHEAVGVGHRVPRQRAVASGRLREGQGLWWAGDWQHRAAASSVQGPRTTWRVWWG